MASGGRLKLEAERDRLPTLLSVAKNRPMTADILAPIEAAAGYWQRGDKALANLRLVYARLPGSRIAPKPTVSHATDLALCASLEQIVRGSRPALLKSC